LNIGLKSTKEVLGIFSSIKDTAENDIKIRKLQSEPIKHIQFGRNVRLIKYWGQRK